MKVDTVKKNRYWLPDLADQNPKMKRKVLSEFVCIQ